MRDGLRFIPRLISGLTFGFLLGSCSAEHSPLLDSEHSSGAGGIGNSEPPAGGSGPGGTGNSPPPGGNSGAGVAGNLDEPGGLGPSGSGGMGGDNQDTSANCGDGTLTSDEACDDGNTKSGDGC